MPERFEHEVVVIGAGLGGIGAGVKLKDAGFNDFVMLEKANDVGGTWRDNTYPGLTVDVPVITYSYSFKQNPNWSNLLPSQPELLEYCQNVTTDYELWPHLRFGSSVSEIRFDSQDGVWHTSLHNGDTYVSRYVIGATGYLNVPNYPDITGLDEFAGKLMHTSSWDNDYDFTRKRVAFIGTGATGIQLIPEIAEMAVEQLYVFQRTPIWLLPKPDFTIPLAVRTSFRRIPGLMRLCRLATAIFMDQVFYRYFIKYRQMEPLGRLAERMSLTHLRTHVKDPELVEKLTPHYTWGCKRPSFSNKFYPVFNRADVELVTDGIERLTKNGIVTVDGIERPIDVLVCGTGFHPYGKESTPTFPVYGTSGAELRDYWDQNHYQAFRGVAIHGYPNYFMVGGPYSIAHGAYVGVVETAVRYIVKLLRVARKQGADYIEAHADAQAVEYQDIREKLKTGILFQGDCATSNSYYYDRFGDTPGFRPSNHLRVWIDSRLGRFVKSFDISENSARTGLQETESAGITPDGSDRPTSFGP